MNQMIKIVGGGASGLMLAEVLTHKGFPVEIYDRSTHLGGIIQTQITDHGIVESAANGLINSASVEAHMKRVGAEIIPTKNLRLSKYLYRGGMRRLPFLLKEWPSFLKGVARVVSGRYPKSDLTVRQWGSQVFGHSITHEVIETVLQGVHGDHTDKLHALSVLPLQNDRRFKKAKGVKGTVCDKLGMGHWLKLIEMELQRRGVGIHKGFSVTPQGIKKWTDEGHKVILCVPCHEAANILKDLNDERAKPLNSIKMRTLTSVTIFFRKQRLKNPGFGVLYPRSENLQVLGTLFNSDIFTDRFKTSTSETFIFGESANRLSDNDLIAECLKSRQLRGESRNEGELLEHFIYRWPQAIPVMDISWSTAVKKIQATQNHSVLLFGNYLGDLGLGKILLAAEELADSLKNV